MAGIEVLANFAVLIVFLAFWATVFLILYHLTRFGVGTLPKKFSALLLFGSVILFGASILLYGNLDLKSLLS